MDRRDPVLALRKGIGRLWFWPDRQWPQGLEALHQRRAAAAGFASEQLLTIDLGLTAPTRLTSVGLGIAVGRIENVEKLLTLQLWIKQQLEDVLDFEFGIAGISDAAIKPWGLIQQLWFALGWCHYGGVRQPYLSICQHADEEGLQLSIYLKQISKS